MVSCLLFLFSTYSLAFDLQGVVITSSNTPSLLIQTFQTLQTNTTSLTLLQYSSQNMDFISNNLPNFIVDASSSSIVSHHLDTFSSLFRVLLLKIGKPEENKTRSVWKFFSSPSIEYETEALQALISLFDWDTFHLFSSQKSPSLQSARNFKNWNEYWIFEGQMNIVTELMGQQVMIDCVGRLIKPTGNWKFLIFNEQESSSKILEAVQKLKMMKKGCGLILNFSGLQYIPKQIILLAEEGTEASKNYYEFQVKQLQLLINMIETKSLENCLRRTRSNDCLLEKLKEETENGGRVPTYLILNSKQENILTPIGRIQRSQITLEGNLTLPGGQIQFTNEKLQIRYSQNSGYINHLGEVNFGNYIFFGAIHIYIDIINQDDSQLENFEIVPTQVDCGSQYFYYDYFKECFQGFRDSLGSFYLQNMGYVTYSTTLLWREMGIDTFTIAYFTQYQELFDKQLYPQITLTVGRKQIQYTFLPTFLLYNGWQNIVVLETLQYQLEGSSKAFYNSCQNNRITVHNSQQSRVLPDLYTTDQHFQEYKHFFQEYYDTGIRVVILLQMWDEYLYIIQSLYKIGFRKGDIQILSVYDPQFILLHLSSNFQQNELMNIKSLLNGSLWMFQGEYVDEFQYTLKPLVQEALYPFAIDSSCFSMDMLQLGALGVDTLLTTGRDYQDPILVNESVRVQRFKGCSGTFSIDSSSNERRDVLYFIGYITADLSTGETARFVSATYSAVQNPVLTIEDEFQYSNESTSPPPDKRFKSWDCDFPMEIVQENTKSLDLQAIVLSSVVGGSLLIGSLLVCIFRKKKPFEISSALNIMGLDDILMIFSIAIENIQYLEIGPSFSKYNYFVGQVDKYSSILVINMYDWEKLSFWIYIYVCYGISAFWVLFIVAYFLTLLFKNTTLIRRFFFHIGQNVMPGLTNIFLIPLLMSLFQILQCNDGISQELEDSYMNRDCDTFCWKDNHFKQSVVSLCIVFVLNISTILYKYIHSIYSTNTNIQILPVYSFIRILFQISVSVLNLTVKNRFPMIFNICFSLLIIGKLIVSHKLLIYNYKRIQLMQVFSVTGVVWSVLLTTIFDLGTGEEIYQGIEVLFMILQILGWIVILVVFFFIFKKLPRVFKKQKSRYDLIGLFRFMLGKEKLKTQTLAALKYGITGSEGANRHTIIQSENIQSTPKNLINRFD